MNLIMRCQFGSHVYGTNTPESDTDFKGIFLPEYRDIILQRPPRVVTRNSKQGDGKNTASDVDEEFFSLNHWFTLFQQGQTLCYDMLFTPKEWWTHDTDLWTTIQNNKHRLVTSKVSAFAGYCQAQAAKYSLKGSNLSAYRMAIELFSGFDPHRKLNDVRVRINALIDQAKEHALYNEREEPLIKIVHLETKASKGTEEYLQVGPKTKVPFTANCKLATSIFQQQFDKYGERARQAETNEGVDWKALMHAVRVCAEAQELLLTGNITFPRPEADLLLKIRKGELDYRAVSDMIVSGLDDLHAAKAKTTLPPETDKQWIEDLIYDAYSSNRGHSRVY